MRSAGFTGLLATQFLGAFNDNMFRWLVVPIGQRVLGGENPETMALVLGGVCFTLPYLVLVAAAGSLADRFSKRSVIVGCKIAEIGIMLLGTWAVLTLNQWFLFTAVMLMGAQSALFGPAKFGSLPEMLGPEALSKGNGVLGLATVVASALGTVAGFRLFDLLDNQGLFASGGIAAVWPAAAALIGIALLGMTASLWIPKLPAANPAAAIKFDPLRETVPALRCLFSEQRLLRAAVGIAFFWFLASLAQLNIDPFADIQFGLEKKDVGILLAVLVAGLGAGSVLAGWWSGGKVELGIVPLGTIGIIVSSLMLYVSGTQVDPTAHALEQGAFWWSCFWLFQLGVSAGLFNIPLETYLQHESDERNRGTVLAGSNFVSFSFILFSCGLFFLLRGAFELSPAAIFMVAGLGTVPVAVYVLRLPPDVTLRFVFWLASHSIYRLWIYGREHVPEKGGAGGGEPRLVGRRRAGAREHLPSRAVPGVFGLRGKDRAGVDGPRDASHPDPRHRRTQGDRPRSPERAGRRAAGRTRLHLRRGTTLPDRTDADLPAGVNADRRRQRRAGDSGVPARAVGEYLQLRGGPLLLEAAQALAVSGVDSFW